MEVNGNPISGEVRVIPENSQSAGSVCRGIHQDLGTEVGDVAGYDRHQEEDQAERTHGQGDGAMAAPGQIGQIGAKKA